MTELAALAVQPSTFDPMKALLVASQLRQADATNSLANLAIDERRTGQNALLEYNRRMAAGDPRAMDALNIAPEKAHAVLQTQAQAQALKTAQDTEKRSSNARAALSVMALPEGPERDAEWAHQLDQQLKAGHLAPAEHASLSQQKPNTLFLKNVVTQALSPEGMSNQINQEESRAETGRFLKSVEGVNEPPAGRPVRQSLEGAISPLTAADPSQGLPYEPLSPTPRLSPQQVAQARTQPQLDPNSGNVTPAMPPVPYVTPVGPDGDYALPSAGPIGGPPGTAPARAAAPTPASPTGAPALAKGGLPPAVDTMTPQAINAQVQMMGGDKSRLFNLFLAGSVSQNKQVAEASKEMLKIVSDENKTPEDIKKYSFYRMQKIAAGEGAKVDDYTTWTRKNSEAGRPQVTIDQTGASELTKEVDKHYAEVFKDGLKAGDDLTQIGRLGELLERSGTGANVAIKNAVREWTGVSLGQGAGAIEGAKAAINYMAPRLRTPGSGAQSDKELNNFMASMPGLMSDPEGKRIVLETLGGMAKFRQMRGDIVGDIKAMIQRGDINPDTNKPYATSDINTAFKSLPDPYKAFKDYQAAKEGKAGKAAAEVPMYQNESDVFAAIRTGKLKHGGEFKTPDGSFGTVNDAIWSMATQSRMP